MNKNLTTGIPELHPIPVNAPWYQNGIDYIGASPPANGGSRFILIVSDFFIKLVEASPTHDKMACAAANALFKVW